MQNNIFSNGLSAPFSSERGVKQGVVLIPLLFKYFINNLVDYLNKDNTDPVVIGDTSVNILLYADDIVLLSQSKEGLQNSLNILHDFCYAWKLNFNTHKSKIMVFNSNGKTYLNQFTYNNVDIVTVANYCYLRMVLKFNGNLNLAINTLMEKARKAYFKIKKTIGLNNFWKNYLIP